MRNEQTTNDETLTRWTATRRVALVLAILRGETTAAARRHGLTVAEIAPWKERVLGGAEHALRSRPLDDAARNDQAITRLPRTVGALVMDIDIRTEASTPTPAQRQLRDACGRRCLRRPSAVAAAS